MVKIQVIAIHTNAFMKNKASSFGKVKKRCARKRQHDFLRPLHSAYDQATILQIQICRDTTWPSILLVYIDSSLGIDLYGVH